VDLLKLGQQLLGDKLGDNTDGMMEALSGLTNGDGLDLGGIMEKMKAGGLGDQLESFLGDGENQDLSADQVKSAFGEDGLANVANKLGVDTDSAAAQLKDILPGLLDKASSGGNLMESLSGGGADGLLDMAKGFLKK
jgi:uncharacterized protein YidB (DUF937 family)